MASRVSTRTAVLALSSLAALPAAARAAGPAAFINEIHYDNAGTDVGEFIEVAAPAGTDLTGWTVELYSAGTRYDTDALAGVVPDQQNGWGTLVLAYPVNGLQNGPVDGVALVNPSMEVVQLLSYEGTFTAVDGAASGMTSTDIGVSESSSDPAGQSLQLQGSGTGQALFAWAVPAPQTAGQVNTGQTFLQPLAIKIRKVAMDFVELQMYAPGQTQLGGHKLTAYGGGGTLAGSYTFPAGVPLVGASQRRISVSLAPAMPADFEAYPFAVDYGAGALCFDDTDCVAWGPFGSTADLPSPAGTPAAMMGPTLSLARSIAAGCPTWLEEADDTNDGTDFALDDLSFRDNASPIPEVDCGRIFGDGFESGDLSAWDVRAVGGGDLGASAEAALGGTTFGLRAEVNDTAGLYVQDDAPTDEGRYRARFRFDTNGFDPGEDEGHFRTRVFIAFDGEPVRRLAALVLRRQNGLYGLMGRVRRDDNSQANTGFFPIANGEHVVEIDWQRSSGPDADDGSFRLWLDGVPVSTLAGVDNGLGGVDFVRLGALSVKTGANGILYWDEFESHRENYIGP
jgi:hypothetical protein